MDPKAFWQSLEAAEKARREREHLTREAKVRPQFRVASNDEPEPTTAPRTILRARSLNQTEQGK